MKVKKKKRHGRPKDAVHLWTASEPKRTTKPPASPTSNKAEWATRKKPRPKMEPIPPGTRFGKWVVVGPGKPYMAPHDGRLRATSLCRCECGRQSTIRNGPLRFGLTQKCVSCKYRDAGIGHITVVKGIATKAAIRGLSFAISDDDGVWLVQQPCFYCGRHPEQRRGRYLYNGLDRVDNSRGYEPGNVVPCCGDCNRRKGDITIEDIRKIVAFLFDGHTLPASSSSSSPADGSTSIG